MINLTPMRGRTTQESAVCMLFQRLRTSPSGRISDVFNLFLFIFRAFSFSNC